MWRLIQEPIFLAGQILKAKYLHSTNILNAKIGHNPSFIWRSIHSSITLIQVGIFWRIGDGRTLGIWGDRWLLASTSFQVQSRVSMLPRDPTVQNLIEAKTYSWKRDLLAQIFSEEEAETIRHIHISMFGAPDKLT